MSKSRRTCEICGIKEAHSPEPLFFANFPLDENRCKEWVRLTGNEDLIHLPMEKLHKIKYVCGLHFKNKDFTKARKRLKKHATPSLNLTASPLSANQMTNFPLHIFSTDESIPSTSRGIQSGRGTVAICNNAIQNVQVSTDDSIPSTSRGIQSGRGTAAVCNNVVQYVQETKKRQTIAAELVSIEPKGVKRQFIENEELTPRKKKLVEKLAKTKCTLSSLKKSSILIEKIDSPVLRELILNSCKNERRKPRGRRWTTKHKLSCLAILKRSPKAYGYLSSAVPLPCVKTLINILKKIPMQPGINQVVINYLHEISKNKTEKEKICCLVFDEMAIKSRLIYNESADKVEGYEDLGEYGRNNNLADHALVFLLQGIYKKFKQPLAFYFTKGTISSAQLSIIIKKIIVDVAACGYTILNTVCDQGPTNMGALKLLKEASGPFEDGANHYFKVDGKIIFIIYDIPHLFKSLRNNFLNNGNIVFNGQKAKWEHLVEMETHNRSFLYLNKITQTHVNPKYKSKMRVKLAAQLLSNTTAAVLTLMAQAATGLKAEEMKTTASVVRELDMLFDVTNGPSGPNDRKKGIRVNVSEKTPHMDRWQDYIKKMKNTKFVNHKGNQSSNVKCVEGYIISLKSLRDIWKSVQALEFKYLNLRNLNQDALENLFGVVRQHSPTNRNPTVTHFIAALKTAVVTGLTAPHSRGANCEKDNKDLLTDFHNIVFKDEEEEEKITSNMCEIKENLNPLTSETFVEGIFSIPEEESEELTENDFSIISEQPTVYVAGYLASQILKKINCEQCKQFLCVSNPEGNAIYSYIMLREWWKNKLSLTYPSIKFCETVKLLIDITEKEVLPKLHEPNICVLGCTIYAVHSLNEGIACNLHAKDLLTVLHHKICKLLIRRQCQRVNQSLASKEEELSNINKKAEQQGKAK